MNEELFNYTKMCCDVDGFSEDEEDYIYGHIIKVSNPYLSVSDNYNNLYVEIFHDASGYLGQNLSDADFEIFVVSLMKRCRVETYSNYGWQETR